MQNIMIIMVGIKLSYNLTKRKNIRNGSTIKQGIAEMDPEALADMMFSYQVFKRCRHHEAKGD